MKKIISLMLFITSIVYFTSCSKEKEHEEELPSIPANRYMKVGESFNLGYASNWVSSNTFVATVDNEGIITAVREGTANIYSRSKKLSCDVSVLSTYTLYSEPITQWGISKNSVISKKGTAENNTDSSLGYKTEISIAPIEMYLFKNDKLYASAVMVKAAYSDELVEHLLQRYKPVYVDTENYSFYFIDAETVEDAETAVVVELYNVNYWQVLYMENPTTRSVVNQNELLEIVKSNVESIGIIKE